MGDVNGDGLADLVLLAEGSDGQVHTYTAISQGDGTFDFLAPAPDADPNDSLLAAITDQHFLADTTGDGLADIITVRPDAPCGAGGSCGCPEGDGQHYLAVAGSVGYGNGEFQTMPVEHTCWPADAQVRVGEANGDHRTDLMAFRVYHPSDPYLIGDFAHIYTGLADGSGSFDVNHDFDTGRYLLPSNAYASDGGDARCFGGAVAMDANGDGRTDLAIPLEGQIVAFYSHGDGTYASYTQRDSDIPPTCSPTTESPPPRWVNGDFNGDGRDDLAFVQPHDADADFTVTRIPSGGEVWDPAVVSTENEPPSSCLRGACWGIMQAMTGDITGSGHSDVIVAGVWDNNAWPPGTILAAFFNVDLSTLPGYENLSQWRPVNIALDDLARPDYPRDLTAVQSLVSALPISDGRVQIRELHPGINSWEVYEPGNVSIGGDPPPSDAWRTIAFDRSGRTGLVAVQTGLSGVEPRVVALVPGRGGWHPVVSNVAVPASNGWQVADVTGDGLPDLVRAGATPGDDQVSVSVLINGGDGHFTLEQTWPNLGYLPADSLNWHAVDVDGDGHADLVNISWQPDTSAPTVVTLLRRGAAWYRSGYNSLLGNVPDVRDQISNGGPAYNDWIPMDVNQDGATDFANVWLDGTGAARVSELVSSGNGTWTSATTPVPSVTPVGGSDPEEGADWHPGGGLPGSPPTLLHVLDYGASLTLERLVRHADGTWQDVRTFAPYAGSPRHTGQSWMSTDLTGTGQTSLVRAVLIPDDGSDIAGDLDVLAIQDAGLPPVMQSASNGLGTTQSITYAFSRAYNGKRYDSSEYSQPCTMPAGQVQLVTDLIQTTDEPSHTTTLRSEDYSCPAWSPSLRTLLAWGDTSAYDFPARISVHQQRMVDPVGVVQPVLSEFEAPGGISPSVWANFHTPTTKETYAAVGDTPPYQNALTSEVTSGCDASGCHDTSTKYLHRDEFGNVTQSEQDPVGSPASLTTTHFALNPAAFIVSRPRKTVTTPTTTPQSVLRETLICYDGDRSRDCHDTPTRGLPTTTRTLNNMTGRYITNNARYDAWGNDTATTDGNGHTTTVTFDPATHLFATRSCNALQQCTRTPSWDRTAEAPTTVLDPNGYTTSTTYDPLGRRFVINNALGDTVKFDYVQSNTAGTVQTHTTTGSNGSVWTRTYTDGEGRTYRADHQGDDPSHVIRTDTEYSDDSSRPWRISAPHYASGPPSWDTFTYDNAGRETSDTHADRSNTDTTYDITTDEPLPGITTQDENRRSQTRFYAGDGLLAMVQLERTTPGPTPTTTTRTDYDALGRPIKITDADGNITTGAWNSLGRLISMTDPDRGDTFYTYDNNGNLTSRRDALDRVTTFKYDALNRVSKRKDSPGTTSIWVYDQRGHGAAVGQLTSVRDASARHCHRRISASLTYNAIGEVTSQTQCVMGTTMTTGSTYDSMGRLTSVTYPDGETVPYTYDPAGDLATVGGYVNSLAYNAAGQATQAAYANGTTESWTYDPMRLWLTRQQVTGGDRDLYDAGYSGYWPDGSIQATTSTTNHMNETYTYDPLGRLTGSTGDVNQTFSYDDIGNITSNSEIGAYSYGHRQATCNSTHPVGCGGPHAVTTAGPTSLQYDADGELLQETSNGRTTRTIEWNAAGLPANITYNGRATTNLYDASGTKVQQTTAAGPTKFFGPTSQWSRQGGLVKYIYAGGLLVASHQGQQKQWYTVDPLGSPRIITGAIPGVFARIDYSPFGEAMGDASDAPMGYGGHFQAGDSGLVDMGARFYDPALARFISPDTIIPTDDPQALNRYSYANNDPISYNDPTGHAGKSETCPSNDACVDQGGGNGSTNAPSSYGGTGDPTTDPQQQEPWPQPEGAKPTYIACGNDKNSCVETIPVGSAPPPTQPPQPPQPPTVVPGPGVTFGLTSLNTTRGAASQGDSANELARGVLTGLGYTNTAGQPLLSGVYHQMTGWDTLFSNLVIYQAQALLGMVAALPIEAGTSLYGLSSLSAREGEVTLAGSIRNANPLGGSQNCVNCVIAGDAILSGANASARDSLGPQSVSVLEREFGGSFARVGGEAQITQMLEDAGPGARGIVYGERAGGVGHVFNAVNQGGVVRYLDAQIGGPASFEGYSGFKFLWTNR